MKQHYTKIFLFVFTLNILIISLSNEHNKNKIYITSHTQTNRSLCESDTESSIYDKDEDMESVKEIFERQISQRFEEYEERMKEKRQKRKEQRDKNIQKIIHKDKMEKKLAEKIEKGCLMCGCGLGSVAGSVGLFGGIAINIWKPGALKIAIDKAIAEGAAEIASAANAAGDAAGAAKLIELVKSIFKVQNISGQSLGSVINPNTYTQVTSIYEAVSTQYLQTCKDYSLRSLVLPFVDPKRDIPICRSVLNQTSAVSQRGRGISDLEIINKTVETIVSDAKAVAADASAAKSAELTAAIKARETGVINTIFMSKQTAIIASIIAIIIIVFIMLIIYLILRYRRKKKMKKKAQYTKLLNQ
ncbi:rifin [Plasmodium reichenowi]|uniref:Rifin n=1 Tax=Plasmodium reichenowi TaxID=5854 RepID=A0A060RM10_PLARE|nr:rifin [Plasmodium reichenowi]